MAQRPWLKILRWRIWWEQCLIVLSNRLWFPFFLIAVCYFVFFHRSSRERSSHTRERECLPSEEGWREEKPEDRDWVDREVSPPAAAADRAKDRERERSLSFERDRRSRSSSEERESGEIWAGGLGVGGGWLTTLHRVFDLNILFSKKIIK